MLVHLSLSHLPNLEPGLRDTAGAAESASQRSSGVTRAESMAWPPAAGCEKRPAQLSMAMTCCLSLQKSACSFLSWLAYNDAQGGQNSAGDHLLKSAVVLFGDGVIWVDDCCCAASVNSMI